VTTPEPSPPAELTDPPAIVAPAAPEPAAPEVAPAPAATRPPGPVRRVLGWFWRGRELRALDRARRAQSARVAPLESRARLLYACAEHLATPAESLPASADPVAYDLYRRAAYWAARALSLARGAGQPEHATPWTSFDAETFARLERAAGSAELEARVEAEDVEIWQLPRDQQAQRAEQLRRVAAALIAELEAPARARDSLLLQRVFRIGAVFALIAAVFGVVSYLQNSAEERRDLATGKPWRASSTFANLGCTSPVQQCSESPDFFFHTREESNAWVEIDLGTRMRFSAVRVINRRDCCFERAVPLVLEVADQPEAFHEIARRTSSFSSWLATFPATEARYVRLRGTSRNSLHLAQVRVLR
jgi:hypothetical protein